MRQMTGAANVVNCDDFRVIQHDDGIGWDIFIKMELLTPLTKVLDQNEPEKQAVKVGKDICNALILCRKLGIVHRDVKPQNIFVSWNGDYKLGDFGIAKVAERTSGGTKTGTFRYMAPEVYNNQPYNHSVDVYSLGMVLHWMLNEYRAPFAPLPPAPVLATQEDAARERRFRGEPIPAPLHGSQELKRIVLKACAFDPRYRYQSAEEMLRDLENLEEMAASPTPPVPPVTPIPDGGTVGVWYGAGNMSAGPNQTVSMQGQMPKGPASQGFVSQGPWPGSSQETIYQNACRIEQTGTTAAQLNEALAAFDRLGDYKDARIRANALSRRVWELEDAEHMRAQREREEQERSQQEARKKKTGLIILIISGAVFLTILGLIIGLGQSCNSSKNQNSTSQTRANAETDARTTAAPTSKAPSTRASSTTAPTTTKAPATTQSPTTTKAPSTTAPTTTTEAPTTTKAPTTTEAPTEMNKQFLGKWYGDLGSEFILYADGTVVWNDGGSDKNQLKGNWTLKTSNGRFVIDMYRDSDYKRFCLYCTLKNGYDSTEMKKMKADWSKTESTVWYYESFYRTKPKIKTKKEQQPYP
jgi:serine/threonine protein kinase